MTQRKRKIHPWALYGASLLLIAGGIVTVTGHIATRPPATTPAPAPQTDDPLPHPAPQITPQEEVAVVVSEDHPAAAEAAPSVRPSLTAIYRSMRPAAVASALLAMTDAEAAQVLISLDSVQVAMILEQLPAERSIELQRIILNLP